MKEFKNRWADPWKMLGDFAIIAIPLLIAAVQNAPNVAPIAQYWTVQGATILLAGVNLFSKTQQNK